MKTAVPRQHLVDVASPSDTTALRNYLRTILTHLVDLHDEGKNADALFGGGNRLRCIVISTAWSSRHLKRSRSSLTACAHSILTTN